MDSTQEQFPRKGLLKLQRYTKTKFIINDIKIDNINIWKENKCKDRDCHFVYDITLSPIEIQNIVEKVKTTLYSLCIDPSQILYNNTNLYGILDDNLLIKHFTTDGKLIAEGIKVITLPNIYGMVFTGIFSPIVSVSLLRNGYNRKAISFEIEDINIVDNCIKYMNDEI